MAWYTAGGAPTPTAAFQPIGAASLAASYTDLSGNGNTAATGVAPSWATETGWTFNGTTQYLTTPVAGNLKPVTVISRVTFSSAGTIRFIWAGNGTGGMSLNRSQGFGSPPGCMVIDRAGVAGIGNSLTVAPANGSTVVVGVTYSATGVWTHYLNGATDGSGTNNVSFTSGLTTEIGRWLPGGASYLHHGTIAALAVYNAVLTGSEMTAVMAAMAALPTAAAAVASISQAHGLYLGSSLGGA